MEELPHRDIYSGMVAEELAKSGAFGREEDRYGFCSWSAEDGYRIFISENEDECAREQFRRWMLWNVVSERVFRRARLYDGEAGEHLDEAMRGCLETEVMPLLKANVKARSNTTSRDSGLAITDYARSLPCSEREKSMVEAGMVSLAWHRGLVGKDYRADLVRAMAEDLSKREPGVRYGFVYRGASGLESYSNAYFPAVWDCWRDVASPSAIVRLPVNSDVPAWLQKKAADKQLMALLGEGYFSAIREVLS